MRLASLVLTIIAAVVLRSYWALAIGGGGCNRPPIQSRTYSVPPLPPAPVAWHSGTN